MIKKVASLYAMLGNSQVHSELVVEVYIKRIEMLRSLLIEGRTDNVLHTIFFSFLDVSHFGGTARLE
jgi:hypothetical protein